MFRLIPEGRCTECGGLLAQPDLVLPEGFEPPTRKTPVRDEQPADYLCIDCLRPYWLEGEPPALLGPT